MSPTVGVRLVDHAVLRVAAWPIEITDAFAAPALAAAARDLLASAPVAEAELADELFVVIPTVEDPRTRRWLLAVRRALAEPRRPVPVAPDDVALGSAHAALAARIAVVETARRDHAAQREDLAALFAAELQGDREALRELASTPRFRTALVVAEPTLATQSDATIGKPLNEKARVLRLEATLFHFAMRACGRPTPNGGWSGVAPVLPALFGPTSPRAVTSVFDASADDGERDVHVSVDLAPFAAVLDAWGRELGAAQDHPLVLESTLFDLPAAGQPHQWVYLRRDTDPFVFAALPTVPALREAAARWAGGRVATPAALYDEIGAERGRAIVEHLLACGILRSALRLPAFARTPAAALASVTSLLPDALARPWCETLDACAAATDALAAAFLADDPAAVARHRDTVVLAVSALTERVGLGPAPARGLVHVDLRVPWRVTWTAAGRARVGSALDEVFAFHADDGGAEAYRQIMQRRVEDTLASAADWVPAVAGRAEDWCGPSPQVATRAELLRAVGADPEAAMARWTDQLEGPVASGVIEHELVLDPDRSRRADPGAAGSFILGVSGPTIWARWGRPQPAMFVTRFGPLLETGPRGARTAAPVRLSTERALHSLLAVRIVGTDAANPNAALRPVLSTVGTWDVGPCIGGPSAGADRPAGAEPPAGGDPSLWQPFATDRGVLVVGADGRARVPIYDSAAVIGTHDPVTRFQRTVAMTNGWELVSWGFPVMRGEQDGGPGLPRLVLPARGRGVVADPDGRTVLSPRRWLIGADTLAALRDALDEVDRYLVWRAALDERQVPARVIVRWDLRPDAPELALMSESPLALRCLCERLPLDATALVLTELPGPVEDWPVQGPDGHHLSELAVTWVRRDDELDPAVFPGGEVPQSFIAVLDALRDLTDEDTESTTSDVAIDALLTALVDRADRAAVSNAAASWLTRVANTQDPEHASTFLVVVADQAPAVVGEAEELEGAGRGATTARLRTDLDSLRPAFDRDVAAIAATTGLDALAVRAQLVGRLGHIHAVELGGEGPDRLRREAARWLAHRGDDAGTA